MKQELRTYKRQIATKGLFQRLITDDSDGMLTLFRGVLDRLLLDLIEPRISGKIRRESEEFWRDDELVQYVSDMAGLDSGYVRKAVRKALELYEVDIPWEN